jgi:[ribosomal protein S5]-alanine N-acetyltransferase
VTDRVAPFGSVHAGDGDAIETARLVLRPFPVAFARAVVAGDVTGFDVAVGYPHRDTSDVARSVIEQSESSPCGTWIITTRSDGVMVGDCGWFLAAGTEDAVEVGCGVAETARHQGFATEAVAALVRRLSRLGVARIVATTDNDNHASARVLEKLGFRPCESSDGQRRYERLME